MIITLVILSVVLSFSSVQTSLANKLTNYVNNKYKTDLHVEKIDLSYLGQLKLKNVLIKDTKLDTIIYTNIVKTSLLNVKKIIDGNLLLGEVYLSDLEVIMKTYKGEEEDELSKFADKFKKRNRNKTSRFLLTSKHVYLVNGKYTLIDENKGEYPIVSYKKIHGEVLDFKIKGTEVFGKLRNMKTIDLNGLEIQKMDTDFTYSSTEMQYLNTHLQTKKSDIYADVVMTYKEGDLSDFINKVKIQATIAESDVALIDIKKFYAELGTEDIIHFSTVITGTLNDFITNNLILYSDKNAVIEGELHFIRSFDETDKFQLIANLKHLESDYYHLKSLLPDILGSTLPDSFKKLGHFIMSGKSHITTNLINAQLSIKSAIGNIKSDLIISNFDNINQAKYEGSISLRDIKIGELIKDPLVGLFSMDADVKGKGFSLENLDAHIKGKVFKHQYKGYTYQKIEVEGNVKDKLFAGMITADDPNIKFNFKGLADLSLERFRFDFTANVAHAEFNKLNLFKRDSISILKGDVKMEMLGNKLENMVGSIQFKNATYINQIQDYNFKDFNIVSTIKDSIQTLKINSTDIVNGQIKGKFIYKELGKLAQNAAGSIYTNYKAFEVSPNQYLDFRFNIFNHVVSVFFPDVKLGANTSIRGKINSDNQLFKLKLKSPEVLVYDNYIEKIRLQIDNKNPLFNTQLSANKIETKLYQFSEIDLVNVTLNDTLYFRTEFKGGKQLKDNYNLAFYHTIDQNNQSILGFQKSNITFNKIDWVLNPENDTENRIVYNIVNNNIDYKDLLLASTDQKILFYGFQNQYEKNYNIDLDRINLEEILPDIANFDFKGLINGGIWIEQRNNMLVPTADIQILDLIVNDNLQGDLIAEIKGAESNKNYNIDLYLEKEDLNSIIVKGDLDIVQKKPIIDINVDFTNFQIDILNAIGQGVMENVRGDVTGVVSIEGDLGNPNFTGALTLNNSGLFFPYTNVDYTLENDTKIRLNNKSFNIDNAIIYDTVFESSGMLSGSISHNKFRKWYLDLGINTANLLAINTEEKEESMFYGTGFLKGNASITGDTDNVNIAINGSSNIGTEIIIPMSDLKTVEPSNLIHFKRTQSKERDSQKSIREKISERFNGVTMDFNLDITKDATLQIVIDKSTGSSLSGNGSGTIQMDINTKGTFNMFGNYLIDKGYYHFKYGGLINKPFAVKKGGSISFNGDPYKAELDIEAVYSTRANPKAILTEYTGTQRLPVDLTTKLTGELFNSTQEFDISIPNASIDISSELDFILNENDTSNMMLQFISLLTIGSFFKNDDILTYAGSSASNEGVHSVAALVSNALLDIFSDPDDKLQIGLDYTKGNTLINTEDQLGLSMATRLGKNEKIIINGEVNVPTGSQSNANIAGNVSVEMSLNKEESLRMKVFNRQNDIQYSSEEQGYTQGMGLLWHFSFDKKDTHKNKKNKTMIRSANKKGILKKKSEK